MGLGESRYVEILDGPFLLKYNSFRMTDFVKSAMMMSTDDGYRVECKSLSRNEFVQDETSASKIA